MNGFYKMVLLLIFMGFFFIFYNFQIKPKSSIGLCKINLLTEISITQQGQPFRSLRKGEGHWSIEDSDQIFLVDHDALDVYQRFICYMPFVEIFDFPDESVESIQRKYGISDDNVISFQAGAASGKLYVGKLTPSGTEFYLSTSKEPNRIYTAANNFVTKLFLETAGLLSRFPFFELMNVTQLHIEYQGQEWELLRDEKSFYFMNESLPRDLAQTFVGNLSGTFFTDYKNNLSENEVLSYQPEFNDLLISYTDPISGQQKRRVFFKNNGNFILFESFGGKPCLLNLDFTKMAILENLLLQILSSKKS